MSLFESKAPDASQNCDPADCPPQEADPRQQDLEDRQHAQADDEPAAGQRHWWSSLGPGLITGAADDDPSGIGTYSIAGAQFGYGLLWLVTLCIPLMISVQEMCGRLAATTRKGLAAVMRSQCSPAVLWTCVSLLLVANVINIWADLNIIAASVAMLTGGAQIFWLLLTTAVTVALQVFVPYRVYVKYLKWLCLLLLTYVITALLPSVHQDWSAIGRGLIIPAWQSTPEYVFAVVGVLGTTISPYLFFWQTGQTLEEQVANDTDRASGLSHPPVRRELRDIRTDTAVGMVSSQVIAFFTLICAAATLKGQSIESAQQAAQALLPLGKGAYWLFTLGIIGSGLLGIPTLSGSAAYAVAEAAGWREGLYRRPARAWRFYTVLAAMCLAGCLLNFLPAVKPITALLYAAVINGVVAPPLVAVLLWLCNDSKLMGRHRNSRLSNTFGGLTVAIMSVAALYMLWAVATGHAH